MAATNAKRKPRPGIEEQTKLILNAAVDLFITFGSQAVSVSDICKQAKVSRDTFYRCFDDKGSLISQLYQTSVNAHIETTIGSLELDYSNSEWVHRAFDVTIDAILEQHKIAQFLFVESADPNTPAYKAVQKAYGKAALRMQKWCKESGRRVPSKEFLLSLLVASQWLVHNAIVQGMTTREVNKAKQAAEELFTAAFSNT